MHPTTTRYEKRSREGPSSVYNIYIASAVMRRRVVNAVLPLGKRNCPVNKSSYTCRHGQGATLSVTRVCFEP